MKRLSKHLSLFLSLVIGIMCIVSLSGFATAESSMDEALIHDGVTVSEPFIDPDLVGTTLEETQQPGEITPFNAYGERHVYAGTYTTYKTVYVQPLGQPKYGFKGGDGTEITFFQYGGNSHKFTVTIDYKTVTLTAETGKMSGSGIGYTTTVPYKSGYYKFEFIKEYKIITKKYGIYKYNEYLYSVYVHDAGYALSHRWVRV